MCGALLSFFLQQAAGCWVVRAAKIWGRAHRNPLFSGRKCKSNATPLGQLYALRPLSCFTLGMIFCGFHRIPRVSPKMPSFLPKNSVLPCWARDDLPEDIDSKPAMLEGSPKITRPHGKSHGHHRQFAQRSQLAKRTPEKQPTRNIEVRHLSENKTNLENSLCAPMDSWCCAPASISPALPARLRFPGAGTRTVGLQVGRHPVSRPQPVENPFSHGLWEK